MSLSRRGCVFPHIIQHEMLHALGFDHEQTRSDRDQNVRIQLQNVMDGELREMCLLFSFFIEIINTNTQCVAYRSNYFGNIYIYDKILVTVY